MLPELTTQLKTLHLYGMATALAHQLIQPDALILDELGYLPFPEAGGALLFHLVSQLYV